MLIIIAPVLIIAVAETITNAFSLGVVQISVESEGISMLSRYHIPSISYINVCYIVSSEFGKNDTSGTSQFDRSFSYVSPKNSNQIRFWLN